MFAKIAKNVLKPITKQWGGMDTKIELTDSILFSYSIDLFVNKHKLRMRNGTVKILTNSMLALVLITSMFAIVGEVNFVVSASETPIAQTSGFIAPIDEVPTNAIYVTTAGELASIGGAHSDGKYFVLANDIDLTAEWTPIEDFRGITFDGNGHSINNLYVLDGSKQQYAGLFGKIKAEGVTIKDLGIKIGSQGLAASASSLTYSYIGGIVGYGDVIINNCYVTGDFNTTTSSTYVGGLIGCGDATIISSYSMGNIGNPQSVNYAGGLIGSDNSANSFSSGGQLGDGKAKITNSFSTGEIAASQYAGGLIGLGSSAISNSYSTGNVIAKVEDDFNVNYGSAGGLVARGSPIITDCYAIGDISALEYAGGLIGSSNSVTITNSYSSGNVSAIKSAPNPNYAGGLIGDATVSQNVIVDNCYSTGNIFASSGRSGNAGGLIGSIDTTFMSKINVGITNSYTIGDISSPTGKAGGIIGDSGNSSSSKEGGNITITNCYVGGNISSAFSSGGLIGSTGDIKDKNYDNIRISACYTTGNVTASNNAESSAYAGGLIGRANCIVNIIDCYVKGNISASSPSISTDTRSYAGGVIGRFGNGRDNREFSIKECYITGNVSALSSHSVNDNSHAGWLIGEDVTNAGVIADSYYLSTQQMKGNAILRNTYGTPLSSDEMQAESSFAGWNFDSIWEYKGGINNGYPILRTAYIDLSVYATGISLNKTTTTVIVGNAETLNVSIEPSDATNKSVQWGSDNENVATISDKGIVTAISQGVANITVTSEDGGHSATCVVTVSPATYEISINPENNIVFAEAIEGYTLQAPRNVTISNKGNQETKTLTITLEGEHSSNFTVSENTITNIIVGGSGDFAIIPDTGLSAGIYKTTIKISGDNGIVESLDVNFIVKELSDKNNNLDEKDESASSGTVFVILGIVTLFFVIGAGVAIKNKKNK